MSILQLPEGRHWGDGGRVALRNRVAISSRLGAALQLVQRQTPAHTYCAACAAPIDFGAVWRGRDAFCSVDCSLGGNRPA